MNFSLLQDNLFELIASLVLVTSVIAIRTVVTRTILKGAPRSELRRSWVVSVRNASWLIIVLGLAAVWANALESFGTALLAVAVAFVIATKELIQGVLGNFVRATTNMYSIGDRIEVGAHRGDVVDLNLLSTTILEVGPGRTSHLRTGRTVIIPNLKLLDTTVVNESSMNQYVVHSFTVPVSLKHDWKRAEEVLLAAAQDECEPFIEEARVHMEKLEREHGLKRLPLRPRVLLELGQPDRVTLIVRVPAPVGRQGTLEQAILRRYLSDTSWRTGHLEEEPVTTETTSQP